MIKGIIPQINSETGKLNDVLIHPPGKEVENMTPIDAERALYSDILNLSAARKEYEQFESVLKNVSNVHYAKDIFTSYLNNPLQKEEIIQSICTSEKCQNLTDDLLSLDSNKLASCLIEGIELKKTNLTNFLSEERYAIKPLHNFFFIRDTTTVINNKVFISSMAKSIRLRESIILSAIFKELKNYQPFEIIESYNNESRLITYEGGDIIIARDDITIIGSSNRTSTHGIDHIIDQISKVKNHHHIIVQQLPGTPESFIHLDMVFTLLDIDTCMVYDPVITNPNQLQTILITITNHKVGSITKQDNLLKTLAKLGMDLKAISCGGNKDIWIQEREQWHSGTNFFALSPGKVIGYKRNIHTLEELNKNGFEIIDAYDLIDRKVSISDHSKMVITIEGSELARGGGGARCMTLPINRSEL